jgi:small subunit ribosomal protein S8
VLPKLVGSRRVIVMFSDPIADMLTRIRNANMRGKQSVDIPHSKMKLEIARVLKEEGYIADYEVVPAQKGPGMILRIKFKIRSDKKRVIEGLRRVSKPGRRIYCGKDDIPLVLNGLGIAILSTSQGIMTGHKARRLGIGGEVICYVW